MPQEEMHRVSMRIDTKLNNFFTKKSERTGISKSVLMYQALDHYLILYEQVYGHAADQALEKNPVVQKEVPPTF